mgnify:CR=1 FL=1
MGRVNRRIGKSSETAITTTDGTGGGVLDAFIHDYFQRSGNVYNALGLPPGGMSATGGTIADFVSGSDVYRAHVFTTSGTFTVSELSTDASLGNNIEYLVVAGGGGGGDDDAGGGGAGGFRTNLTGHPVKAADYTATVGTYTVTVGGGGLGAPPSGNDGSRGSNSEFYPTPVSYPSTERIRAVGGGGGFKNPVPSYGPGGSGGGSGWNAPSSTYGSGNTPTDPNHPQVQGYDGGANHDSINAGGGGGAGGAGKPGAGNATGYSKGGVGLQCLIAGPPSAPQPVGAPGPGGGTGWFAGGGGGGGRNDQARYGGGGSSSPFAGGGTGGGPNRDVTNGLTNTGGGGGGYGPSGNGAGGTGGSGIVVVRYKIASTDASGVSPKGATGGTISTYSGKVIHTFLNSGAFNVPGSFNETVEYVMVGGGGGGGADCGGGGGAGGYITGSTPITGPSPLAVVIGAGGQGGSSDPYPAPKRQGYEGTDTTWNSLTAGQGGGGGYGNSTGANGNGVPLGSGGGGGGGVGSSRSGGPSGPQGNNGGNNFNSTPGYGAGGGGGAGGTGENGSGTGGGDGGDGTQVPTTFRNPGYTTTRDTWRLAGGGAGTGYCPMGAGGTGGGGGATTSPAEQHEGHSNTGGGGAGEGSDTNSPGNREGQGHNGGSGVVLLAYPS